MSGWFQKRKLLKDPPHLEKEMALKFPRKCWELFSIEKAIPSILTSYGKGHNILN